MAGSSIRQLFVSVRDGARRQRSVSVVWVKMASIRSVGSVAHRQLEQLSSIRTFVWEPSRDSASRRLSPVAAAATGGLIGSGIRHTVLPVNLTSSYSQIKNIGSDCGWTAISPLVARPGGQSASVVAWRGFATDQKGGDKEGREPAPEMGSAKDAEDREKDEAAGYERARETGKEVREAPGTKGKTRAAVDLAKDVSKGLKEATAKVVDVAMETAGRARETAAGIFEGAGSNKEGGTDDSGKSSEFRDQQGRGAHDSKTEGAGEMVGEKTQKSSHEDEPGVHGVQGVPGTKSIPMGPGGLSGPEDAVPGSVQSTLSRS